MRKGITIIIAHDDPKNIKQIRLSYRTLKILKVFALLFAGFIVFLISIYGKVYVRAAKLALIQKRNAYLEARYRQVKKLEEEISLLKEKNRRLANLLGVDVVKGIVLNKRDTSDYPDISYIPALYPCEEFVASALTRDNEIKIKALPNVSVISPVSGEVVDVSYNGKEGVVKVENKKGVKVILKGKFEPVVNVGSTIHQKETIGITRGSDGICELSYEVYLNDHKVNPERFIIMGGK